MWYLLIVAVTAFPLHSKDFRHTHIHQKIIVDKPTDQPYRNKADCERDLALIKKGKPKQGVTLYLTCRQVDAVLNYNDAAEPEHLLREQRGD